jgi:hypothetical protein
MVFSLKSHKNPDKGAALAVFGKALWKKSGALRQAGLFPLAFFTIITYYFYK